MITIQNLAGRLIEMRFAEPVTAMDVTRFTLGLTQLIAKTGSVLCLADMRPAGLFPPAVEAAIVEIMKRDNPLVISTAFLAGPGAAQQQVAGMLASAGSAQRRLCATPAEALAWLEPNLSAEERAQLARVLGLA